MKTYYHNTPWATNIYIYEYVVQKSIENFLEGKDAWHSGTPRTDGITKAQKSLSRPDDFK